MPRGEDSPGTRWQVELRNAVAEPVRRVQGIPGKTVRFRNLAPGNYFVCLTGSRGQRSCTSMELIPAPGQHTASFLKELEPPCASAAGPAQFRVNIRSLSVPEKARIELQLADEDQLDGKIAEMVRHLQKALEICPDYTEAWNNLGAYYHKAGNYDESIRHFSRAVALDPDFSPGWMNLGSSLLSSHKFEDAIEANRKALSLSPTDPVPNLQIGLCYYYLREYGEARKYLQRVIDRDPGFPGSPQLILAHIALGEGDSGEAIGYLQNFLEHHPHSPEAARSRRLLDSLANGSLAPDEASKK